MRETFLLMRAEPWMLDVSDDIRADMMDAEGQVSGGFTGTFGGLTVAHLPGEADPITTLRLNAPYGSTYRGADIVEQGDNVKIVFDCLSPGSTRVLFGDDCYTRVTIDPNGRW